MSSVRSIVIAVSPGELLDRMTMLSIHRKRSSNRSKRFGEAAEYQRLETVRTQRIGYPEELLPLESELFAVNSAIQKAEESMQRCEEREEFGNRYVDLAQSLFRHRRRRAELIEAIDSLVEELWSEPRQFAA